MAEIKDWNVAAASNNGTPPDGAPEGMAPSGVNDVIRENMAVLARWLGDTNGALTATGAADAQLLAPNRTVTAYARGDVYAFRPVADNTGACTLNVSSLGAKSIKTPIGTDPLAGALDTSSVATVIYDGTNFVLVSGAGSASFTNVDIDGGSIDGTAVGGSTPAAGAFTTLTASGDVTVDTDTFFVDVSTDRVGIGTASPTTPAHVAGSSGGSPLTTIETTDSWDVSHDENLLTILGGAAAASNGGGKFGVKLRDSASSTKAVGLYAVSENTFSNLVGFALYTGTDSVFTEKFRVAAGGNVGIGTSSPSEALDVAGNAKASGSHYSRSGTTGSLANGASEALFTGEDSSIYIVTATNATNNADWRVAAVVIFGANSATDEVVVETLNNANLTITSSGATREIELTNTGSGTPTFRWKAIRLL